MLPQAIKSGIALGICGAIFQPFNRKVNLRKNIQKTSIENYQFPKREKLLKRLKEEEFDVLIIGGGATGAGVAYATSSRGMKVALIERNDFASGTSSKCTKMIHGGLRHMKKAITCLDFQEFKLMTECLNERKLLLKYCPNIVHPLPILLPCSGILEFLMNASGLLLLELIAMDSSMLPKYVSKNKIKYLFPFINLDNIYNGIIYYDGQFDDARMNLAVIKSAITMGAAACNYVSAECLLNDGNTYKSVTLMDKITGEVFECRTKSIVNATGPFTDSIRKMGDPDCREICKPVSGTHLSLDKDLTKHGVGLVISEPNNKMLLVLPWEGTTLVGTGDEKTPLSENPSPKKNQVDSMLNRLSNILNDKTIATYKNVKSCWTGIQPLVIDPTIDKQHVASISKNHIIEIKKNLITISGGKWSIFRKMGEDTANVVETVIGSERKKMDYTFEPYGCAGWSPEIFITLVKEHDADPDIAHYLCKSYGTGAMDLLRLSDKGLTRLLPNYPYTEEEVTYICKNDYVCTLEDIVARRMRIAFIDARATEHILDRVAILAGGTLCWSSDKINEEKMKCKKFLNEEMGLNINKEKY